MRNCIICRYLRECELAKEKLSKEVAGIIPEGWEEKDAIECDDFVPIAENSGDDEDFNVEGI